MLKDLDEARWGRLGKRGWAVVWRRVEERPGLAVGMVAGLLGTIVVVRIEMLRAGLKGSGDEFHAILDSIALSAILLTVVGVITSVWLVGKLQRAWGETKKQRGNLEQVAAELECEVAERARAEAAVAAANDRLSTSHAQLERWAADLEIAHTRLREVDHLKTKFLSEVAHELRSPMAAIVSAAKIIVKHHKTRPEVIERFGQTIMSEGARMTRLINDFLDLAKIESGAIEWDDGDIDPAELVRDALHGVDALAVERDIHLTADVAGRVPRICGDRDRLFRVLTNLLHNALKYTLRGKRVTVRAWAEGNRVVFSVDDAGPGIAPEERDKVFDRFHQICAERELGGHRTGTGLGLCIAREIVEHYGGRIWVESEWGKGSSFRFAIPTRRTTQGRAVADKVAEEQRQQVARVLLLLDDPADCEHACHVPEKEGLICRCCESVDDLSVAIGEWKPDALVVGSRIFAARADFILSLVHAHAQPKLLVYSPEHGLTAPSMLDSADVLVPTLRSRLDRGALIYVVDDDPDYRGILEFELGQADFAIRAYSDGTQVLEAVERQAPDAMVLDLIMPGVDGLAVLEQLGQRHHDFPVFVYTGLDDPSVALTARELGAAEVFRKDGGGASYAAVCSRVSRVLGPILGAVPGRSTRSTS